MVFLIMECLKKVSLSTQMVMSMKANSKIISRMVREFGNSKKGFSKGHLKMGTSETGK
jgi:hypothetical protein